LQERLEKDEECQLLQEQAECVYILRDRFLAKGTSAGKNIAPPSLLPAASQHQDAVQRLAEGPGLGVDSAKQ
jgi:hypothetical protein